jgi:response regulator RpfG family c-di-GMP phosphodiesterase
LEPFPFLQDASVLIAHHHERWDGSGYPYGIRGRFIPLGARILSIADTFDAIEVPNTQSPETRALVAFRILRVAAGTQFDPDLVETFGQWLRKRGLDQEQNAYVAQRLNFSPHI